MAPYGPAEVQALVKKKCSTHDIPLRVDEYGAFLESAPYWSISLRLALSAILKPSHQFQKNFSQSLNAKAIVHLITQIMDGS